jgi:hypothetical protein
MDMDMSHFMAKLPSLSPLHLHLSLPVLYSVLYISHYFIRPSVPCLVSDHLSPSSEHLAVFHSA